MFVTLHIGLPKTGTTSLQDFLRNHDAALRARGMLYPVAGSALRPGQSRSSHIAMAAACMDGDHVDGTRLATRLAGRKAHRAARESIPNALAQETTEAGCTRLLISSEHFAISLRTPEEVARLRDMLAPLADGFEVIVYLRDQSRLVPSLYAEMVANGDPRALRLPADAQELDAAARKLTREAPQPWLTPLPDWLDYAALLDLWAGVFGRENLRVRVMEEALRAENGLTGDFGRAIGLDDLSELGPMETRNEAPGTWALAAMRAYNWLRPRYRDGRETGLWQWRRIHRLRRPWGEKLRLPPAQARALRERYAESNARVARDWLGRERLFPERS